MQAPTRATKVLSAQARVAALKAKASRVAVGAEAEDDEDIGAARPPPSAAVRAVVSTTAPPQTDVARAAGTEEVKAADTPAHASTHAHTLSLAGAESLTHADTRTQARADVTVHARPSVRSHAEVLKAELEVMTAVNAELGAIEAWSAATASKIFSAARDSEAVTVHTSSREHTLGDADARTEVDADAAAPICACVLSHVCAPEDAELVGAAYATSFKLSSSIWADLRAREEELDRLRVRLHEHASTLEQASGPETKGPAEAAGGGAARTAWVPEALQRAAALQTSLAYTRALMHYFSGRFAACAHTITRQLLPARGGHEAGKQPSAPASSVAASLQLPPLFFTLPLWLLRARACVALCTRAGSLLAGLHIDKALGILGRVADQVLDSFAIEDMQSGTHAIVAPLAVEYPGYVPPRAITGHAHTDTSERAWPPTCEQATKAFARSARAFCAAASIESDTAILRASVAARTRKQREEALRAPGGAAEPTIAPEEKMWADWVANRQKPMIDRHDPMLEHVVKLKGVMTRLVHAFEANGVTESLIQSRAMPAAASNNVTWLRLLEDAELLIMEGFYDSAAVMLEHIVRDALLQEVAPSWLPALHAGIIFCREKSHSTPVELVAVCERAFRTVTDATTAHVRATLHYRRGVARTSTYAYGGAVDDFVAAMRALDDVCDGDWPTDTSPLDAALHSAVLKVARLIGMPNSTAPGMVLPPDRSVTTGAARQSVQIALDKARYLKRITDAR